MKEPDEMLKDGLDKLEKFRWIVQIDGDFFVKEEFIKLFTESFEECFVNKLESECLKKEMLQVISHPIIQEDFEIMDDLGMDIELEVQTFMLAKRMLEKIGELDSPSPDALCATYFVLQEWAYQNQQSD